MYDSFIDIWEGSPMWGQHIEDWKTPEERNDDSVKRWIAAHDFMEEETTMGLDVTIKEVQEFRCPDCGKLVTTKDVNEVNAGGSDWRDFLKSINYYAKGGDSDWYGKDMVLTEKQARALAEYSVKKVYWPNNDIEKLVAVALLRGHKVVVNAEW